MTSAPLGGWAEADLAERLQGLGSQVRSAAVKLDRVQVAGENNGGFPVDFALSREGGSCRITGSMLGGYPVDVVLSSGRASGRTMGGYPLALEIKGGVISGTAKAYEVSLKLNGLTVTGTGVGRFPVHLAFSASLDDCQLTAVIIAAVHRH